MEILAMIVVSLGIWSVTPRSYIVYDKEWTFQEAKAAAEKDCPGNYTIYNQANFLSTDGKQKVPYLCDNSK